MGAQAVTVTIEITPVLCCNCGMYFGMAEPWRQKRLNDGAVFYCPAGHGQSYTDNELSRAKKELEAEKKRREWAEQANKTANERLTAAHRSNAALRGKVTEMRNRVGNGVCPCCNRSFQNLIRHMQSKHPEFKEPEVEPGEAAGTGRPA